MKFVNQGLAALLLMTFTACSQNSSADTKLENSISSLKHEAPPDKHEENKQVYGVVDSVTASPPKNNQHPTADKNKTKEDWDKKIIKTADLSVETKNYKAFNALLRPGIKQLGGYIAQEEENQSDYKIENVITIKVPVDQFDNAVTQFTPASEKVLEKKITSEDVTTEIVDTKSRMEAKKRIRERYMDLLKQAKNMEEILQVQGEIDGIQEDVEGAAGRIAYLGHSAAYSTIHLTFYQVLNPTAGNIADPSYLSRIAESFKSGSKWFGELFIGLVALWPLWVAILVLWMLIRRYKPSFAKNHKTALPETKS